LNTAKHKVAILDLGSNTSKLLVANRSEGKKVEAIFQKSLPCRILLDKNDHLSESGIDRIINTVSKLHFEAVKFNPARFCIVGTEALRKAKNSAMVREKIFEKTGLKLKILTGKEEATGIAFGICSDPKLQNRDEFHAFDLGGGSMEMIEFSKSNLRTVESLPLGAVTLTNEFISNPKLSLNEEETYSISQYISQCLKENITRENPCGILIGTGGSVVYLRKLHEFCNPSVPDSTTLAFTFKKSFIEDLTKTICSLNILERRKEFHFLPEDRLDIIPSALITILEVMNFMEIDELTHSFHNLRFGIAANPKLMD
jgi:exopolyphosphatase/guanosine-5'-triphosphate,3'-diphosphate pyrophosphatase